MKYKVKFYVLDLIDVSDLIDVAMRTIQEKEVHELSEVLILRLHVLQALYRKFKNKTLMTPPTDSVTFSLTLSEIVCLKHCLMGNEQPGIRRIFMTIDSKVHPAIQLEL